jgi:hypothetical protein
MNNESPAIAVDSNADLALRANLCLVPSVRFPVVAVERAPNDGKMMEMPPWIE